MAKIHIGLIADNKNLENDIKQAAEANGGAYVHQSRNILELHQKFSMQKVQLILIVLPGSGENSELKNIYSFIKGKRELQKIPVCLLTEQSHFETRFLINDPLIRAFPLAAGIFLPLLTMSPLLQTDSESAGTITEAWIQNEFLESLRSKVGQEVQFSSRMANDDERRSPFFCQKSEEVRSHLGWFKFTARLLETGTDGLAQMFQGMSRDMVEEVAQSLIDKVSEDFKEKVMNDLATRGAIFLPEVEKLEPADRKWVYSNSKSRGVIYDAPQCQVLLEINQYI